MDGKYLNDFYRTNTQILGKGTRFEKGGIEGGGVGWDVGMWNMCVVMERDVTDANLIS